MNKYISVLRGINVSGHKKILMADLRTLYETLGFSNVISYIQSGNVVFDSSLKDHIEIKALIEQSIEKKYGFQVPVTILSKDAFELVIQKSPFQNIDLAQEGAKFLVSLLSAKPTLENFREVQKFASETETIKLDGQAIYLHCPNGYGNTKLSNLLLEKKLHVSSTTRNWKTMVKLQELSS